MRSEKINEFVEKILVQECGRKGSQVTEQEVEFLSTLWAAMCRHASEKSR